MSPLPSKEEMDVMDSGNISDDEPTYTEILKDISDGSKYHPNVNSIEAGYKIRDRIRQIKSEWKGSLKALQTWVKV